MALGLPSHSFPRVGHGSYPGCVSQDSWGVSDRKPPQTEINQRGDVKGESFYSTPERADGRLDAGMLGVKDQDLAILFQSQIPSGSWNCRSSFPTEPIRKIPGEQFDWPVTSLCLNQSLWPGVGYWDGRLPPECHIQSAGVGWGEQFPKGTAGKCFWKRRC